MNSPSTLHTRQLNKKITQLRKGVVELCTLAVVKEGEAYGREILQPLRAAEGIMVTESTVNPILSRLSKQGFFAGRYVKSTDGPPRRYYVLTPSGSELLREMSDQWRAIRNGIDGLIETRSNEK